MGELVLSRSKFQRLIISKINKFISKVRKCGAMDLQTRESLMNFILMFSLKAQNKLDRSVSIETSFPRNHSSY